MAMQRVRLVNLQEFDSEYWNRLNEFERVFVAEGDSWFSYGSLRFNTLLRYLELPYSALVLNIAQPGDTLRRMHETTRNPQFYSVLKNRGGRRGDGIFLSGGGNDVIDAAWNPKIQAAEILLRPADPASITRANLDQVIDRAAYDQLLRYVARNIEQIVLQGRDQTGGNSVDVPLFMHTYAPVQPRNAPVRRLKLGPWLYPAMVWLGIDAALWRDLAGMILGDLAATLKGLTLPHFHVIDTLSLTTTIEPSVPGATGDSMDWENEIHPNRAGYKKLAATWTEQIGAVLG